MSQPIGLYIHVPFCTKKCDYCDFYSVTADEQTMDAYCDAVCRALSDYAARINQSADTLYFGGGTPSLLGAERIARIITWAKSLFTLKNAEITVEANPSNSLGHFFEGIASAGANRISMGLQSANAEELRLLTRRHSAADARNAVNAAKQAGIENISLDVMLGVQRQTKESLKSTLDFCMESGVTHISAYLLKVENGTPFYERRDSLSLPDEDEQAALYLFACEYLEENGFNQYEISNFARPLCQSRHNLKYWNAEEYLGIGPSAHSFIDGKRFYYPRSLTDFLDGCEPIYDGDGGDFEEYAMLRLRLSDGLRFADALARYPDAAPALEKIRERAKPLEKAGLLKPDPDTVAMNARGFLLSNSVIGRLLG